MLPDNPSAAGATLFPTGPTLTIGQWLDNPYLARAIRRLGHQYGVSAQDLPDLAQEVRLALWEAGPDQRVNATWIFNTTNHKAVDLLRSRRRASAEKEDFRSQFVSEKGLETELSHLLHARVSRLPTPLATVYRLRFLEGLSQTDVAERLGVGRPTIRWTERALRRSLALGKKPPTPQP